MRLQAKRVYSGFSDFEKLDTLNKEAFPMEERVSMQNMVSLADKKHLELWAMYDGKTFVGFFSMLVHAQCAFVFYLAIDAAQRSKGYGKSALALIRELYPSCQVMLDIEPVDETAANNTQRVKRRQFYLRNGFHGSGYGVT